MFIVTCLPNFGNFFLLLFSYSLNLRFIALFLFFYVCLDKIGKNAIHLYNMCTFPQVVSPYGPCKKRKLSVGLPEMHSALNFQPWLTTQCPLWNEITRNDFIPSKLSLGELQLITTTLLVSTTLSVIVCCLSNIRNRESKRVFETLNDVHDNMHLHPYIIIDFLSYNYIKNRGG